MTNEQQKQLAAAFQTAAHAAASAAPTEQREQIGRAFRRAHLKALIEIIDAGVQIDKAKAINAVYYDAAQVYDPSSDFNI